MFTRQKSWFLCLCVLLLLFAPPGSQTRAAEKYPIKPITFIVPAEAGSDGDIIARPLCQKVSALLGQPVIVVNKPGAGSSIGYREIHDAKPDGYTIGIGFTSLATNRLLGIMPYDHHAFTMIGSHATNVAFILASTKTKRPFRTAEEVFSFARAHPGDVSIATSGKGYLFWFASVALEESTGLKFNIIPQPGGAGFSIAQIAGGHVDLGIMGFGPAKPQVEAGNIRALAVFGTKRFPGANENVPTLKELGYDVRIEGNHFIVGPPKMPKEVLDKLVRAFESAANDPEFKKFLVERDVMPAYLSPKESIENYDEQRRLCRSILERAGMLKE